MAIKMEVFEITPKEEERWNKLLFSSINASYRQCFPFEYAQKLNGREIHTFIFQHGGIDIAGAHYSIKGVIKNTISTADVLSGFVFKNEPDHELLAFLLDHFITWATNKNASYLRVNPWLPKTIADAETQFPALFASEMNRSGFTQLKSGRHTYWIDLLQSEEQLLKRMKPQIRNKIHKAEKSSLLIEIYDSVNDVLTNSFWSLYDSLGKSKGFHTLGKDRYNMEIVSMVNHGLANLFFVKFEGNIVNVTVASNFGESNYYYGAINPNFKKMGGCPSPGPFAQWSMIKFMKSRGLKVYDMGFCPGPIPVEDDPRYSIWRYKYDFGGDHVEFLPNYGKVLKPLTGKIFQYWRYKK
jgi:lipid II:glycine glycyltransferase (peptidoglycan interpeptide bridge formation enzyme)